jgi:replicative DNA helicase
MRSDTFRKVREITPPPNVEGRPPPQSLDAEAAVLSAILVDGTGRVLDQVADFLKPDHFYAEAHRRIFEACIALYADGKATDIVTVIEWLKARERLGQVGGAGYVTEILNSTPALANVTEHARIVHGKAKARAVILACQHTAALGYVDYGTAQDFAAEAAEKLHAIAHEDLPNTTEHVKVVLDGVAKKLIAMGSSGSRFSGKPTGFDRYDRLTSGLHDGDLTIVAARPGMGKTSWALQVAMAVAEGDPGLQGEGVIVFSLEMPRDQVGTRMLCARGKIDVGRARSGNLSPLDFQRMVAAGSEVGRMPLWIDDQAALSVLELRARARRIQSEIARGKTAAKRLGLIVVDYLQLMSGNGDNREQEIAGIARELKKIAKEMRIPVVALSQLNRSVETRGDKRPLLSDLRESGAIEQDADNVVFIFRDDYYTKEKSAEPNVAELIIAKQRNGPTGTVKTRWDREWTRFGNLADYDGAEHDA